MLGIAVNVYYILKIDEIYVVRVKEYINKLIRNYGTNNMELLTQKCEKDSKGNWLVPLLIIIAVVIFFIALIFKNIAFL